MKSEGFVIFSTFPDTESASRISEELVAARLAACANILPNVTSMYAWQGKLERSSEVLVLFKTTKERYAAFEAKLKSLHPYDVPEIVAAPISAGSSDYLQWVSDNCAGE